MPELMLVIKGSQQGRIVITDFYAWDPGGASGKEPTSQCRRHKRRGFHPLEEGLESHSCILALRIPWTEETGKLRSMGLQRVGYN